MFKRLFAHGRGESLQRIERSARIRPSRILAGRIPLPADDLLLSSGLGAGRFSQGQQLLKTLGEVLHVDPGLLRLEDRLDHLLRARRDDLLDTARAHWDAAMLGAYIDVFSYDLLDRLALLSERSGWESQRRTLSVPPRDEDSWIDVLMDMDVRAFLQFFTPAVKN